MPENTMADLKRPTETAAFELRRVGSCDEMLRRDPGRRYATGDNLMLWRTRPDLCGLVLWGRMSFDEVRLLERIFDDSKRRDIAAPCDFILDTRHLHGLDAALYEGLTHAASRRLPDIRRRIRRHALLRSSGLIGAAVSGFYVALDVEIEWRVFTALAPALGWLDEPHPDALAARLDRLVMEAVSESSLADRLRAVIAGYSGGSMSLEDVSRSLGMSPRTLQRTLAAVGTSFRDEVHRARLAMSRKLLLETDDKIAAIAHRIGFSTEANFITFFRRSTGESPAAWRRRSLNGDLNAARDGLGLFSRRSDGVDAAC
jgi:AraC-like DNA-binding protein